MKENGRWEKIWKSVKDEDFENMGSNGIRNI